MIIDLHQDISVKLTQVGVNNFLHPKSRNEKLSTYSKYSLIDQADLPQLIQAGYRIVLGASCALTVTTKGISLPKKPLNELLYHINAYQELVRNSLQQVTIITTASDLKHKKKSSLGIILAIEGLYCVKNNEDIQLIDTLYSLGVRVIGPFWNIKNALGGGGKYNVGLTTLGKNLIAYLNQKNIIIDGSHASPKTLNDMLILSKKPIIVSHALTLAMTNHYRNLEDSHIKSICKKDGLIGICFIRDFAGGDSIDFVVKHIKHIIKTGSVDNIAIGSDFSAMTRADLIKDYETARSIQRLESTLQKNGFTNSEIERIMWKNALAFLRQNLPS